MCYTICDMCRVGSPGPTKVRMLCLRFFLSILGYAGVFPGIGDSGLYDGTDGCLFVLFF